MKKTALGGVFFVMSTLTVAQTTYDSKTLVDTNNVSTSTSTVNTNSVSTSTNTSTVNSTSNNTNTNVNTSTSTNINHNINSGEQTINNNSTSTSTNTNHNINSGTQTFNNNNNSTSTNTNHNINSGTQTFNNNNNSTSNNNNTSTSNNVNTNIQQGEMTNKNLNDSRIVQEIKQPPPTAIAPPMMSGGNSDLCTTGTSGAVQTQILGISSGGTVRDLNCERLKNAKTLFDMGMKVAAVSTLCQDRRVFDAMWHAGTPCPYEGNIGERAKVLWEENKDRWPKEEENKSDDFYKKAGWGTLLGLLLFKLF